jgi:O-acetyl-ADP-ribose deacetylase (regulator of RNase III)
MDRKKSVFSGHPSLFDELYRFTDEHEEYRLHEYGTVLEEYGLEWDDISLREADVSKMDAQGVIAILFGACRADHFCEGAFDDFAQDGYVSKWLKRLKELDEENAMSIEIQKISITHLETDAIVNAANSGLREGGGVCGAIFKAAGSADLQAACDKIGYCPEGSAVITPAFRLKSKYVVHAVGPMWNGGKHGEPEKLRGAYRSALQVASDNGCKSIGFPLISAGIFGYPLDLAWKEAITACGEFLIEHPDIRIVFAVLNGDIIAKGQETLQKWEADHKAETKAAPTQSPEAKQERDDDFGVWMAQEKGLLKTHYRIFTAPMGGFRDSANYEFIAEFENQKLASNYVDFMRGKKRYGDKDIVVQKVFVKKMPFGEETSKGSVVGVVTVLGESLPVEEYEFK